MSTESLRNENIWSCLEEDVINSSISSRRCFQKLFWDISFRIQDLNLENVNKISFKLFSSFGQNKIAVHS